jgi:hypothetical protein
MIPMKVDVFHGLMGIQILLNHDLTTIIYRMHVFFFTFHVLTPPKVSVRGYGFSPASNQP